MTAYDKFVELRTALNVRHFERYDEINIALAAVLARFHVVLIGPPGTGKSMLSEDLVRSLEGARHFKYLLTKFTTPEEMFGPLNLSLLPKGLYERITDRKLPEAEVAFVDEFFNANSAIQNSMLTIMNERQFDNGTQRIDVPLMTMFAASNTLPEGEELWALFDRFHFRKVVDYVKEPSNFMRMMVSPATAELPVITRDELFEAQEQTAKVTILEAELETLQDIRSDLNTEGIVASDRRYRQCLSALRASAWLDGRDVVEDTDFSLLQHMLWSSPQEVKKVARTVLEHTNPMELQAQEIIDMADEIEAEVKQALLDVRQKAADQTTLTKQGLEWFKRCKSLADSTRQLDAKAKKQGRSIAKIQMAKDRVTYIAREIGRQTIGLEALDMKVD
jgi:MoxR-like ATPase